MDNHKVSIITPCYNAGSYIAETIESVLRQTYSIWEMLIVDDCSTDNSSEIIKQYTLKDARIRYLKTDNPSGSPTLPRNIGVQNAVGRYIAFLDSDDMWLPTKLDRQLTLFEKDNVAIAFSNYEKISETNVRNERLVYAPSSVSYKRLLKGNVIGCLTAIYDTCKVGKIYFQNVGHEDYVAWLSILKKGYIACNTNTNEALYRVRDNSVSSDKLKTLGWQWKIYIKIEKTGFIKGIYYFVNYAFRAFVKSLK